MTTVDHDNLAAPRAPAGDLPWCWRLVDGLLVFGVLALHGAWPAPEINEAHYLLKAHHFWAPHEMQRDVFLASRDSHVTFFAAFGWLSHVMSLESAAWCGRLVAWALVAWGWRRLSWAVAPRFGMAAVSAAALVAVNRYGEMAGEWFVGGVEAKTFAYAMVFAGLADLVASKWNRALVFLGIGTAFHVLVGGWSLVALGGAWLLEGRGRPSLISLAPGLAIAAILSAAGLLPGLLLNRGTPPEVVAEAERIYVEVRIAHHLDPRAFVPQVGRRLTVVAFAWLALYLIVRADPARRRLRSFTAVVVLLVGMGLAIGYGLPHGSALRSSLLKYYWFRLADVVLPMGLVLETAALAVTAGAVVARFAIVNRVIRIAAVTPLIRIAAAAALIYVGARHLGETVEDRENTRMARGENLFDAENLEGWREACAWVRANTDPDALVLAPRSFRTFKWYAARAEFATWKDVPQDAASLIEWKQRLDRLYPAKSPHWVNYLPADHLREVCREYEVDYVVAYVLPPLELPIKYRNNDFTVYAVPRDGRGQSYRP